MSENGPREGTRDLPRSGPEAGRRAVDDDSTAGAAYSALQRQIRRRRDELLDLLRSGLSDPAAAAQYSRLHPLEHEVTPEEVAALLVSVQRASHH